MIITKAVGSLFPGFEKKNLSPSWRSILKRDNIHRFEMKPSRRIHVLLCPPNQMWNFVPPFFLFRFSAKGGSRDRERGAMVQQTTNRTRNWEGGGWWEKRIQKKRRLQRLLLFLSTKNIKRRESSPLLFSLLWESHKAAFLLRESEKEREGEKTTSFVWFNDVTNKTRNGEGDLMRVDDPLMDSFPIFSLTHNHVVRGPL